MAKVNYVIACWMGARRMDDPRAIRDRASFLKAHLEALGRLGHTLDQITIVLAEGGDAAADAYAKSITNIGGTPVVVLCRNNCGYSYGSWNHAYETFTDRFTHYILVEDDYMPCFSSFDQRLMQVADDGGYVCGLVTRPPRSGWPDILRHAAISNGVIRSDVWAKVHPAPVDARPEIDGGNNSQVIWSAAFDRGDVGIRDWCEDFASPFWRKGAVLVWHGRRDVQPMFVPVQAVGRPVKIRQGDECFVGTLTRDGSILRAGEE